MLIAYVSYLWQDIAETALSQSAFFVVFIYLGMNSMLICGVIIWTAYEVYLKTGNTASLISKQ